MITLNQYIPLQNGQAAFFKKQNLISNLLGTVGYEVRDGYVIFTEDITDPQGKNTLAVDMQLVVMDFDKYDDYDLLPLSADMAAEIIQKAASMLMQTPPPDNRVDALTEENIKR